MKKENNKKHDINTSSESLESPSRRKVMKKAAYVAPALVVLGVLSPIDAVALPSGPPPPPNSPLSPLYQEEKRKK